MTRARSASAWFMSRRSEPSLSRPPSAGLSPFERRGECSAIGHRSEQRSGWGPQERQAKADRAPVGAVADNLVEAVGIEPTSGNPQPQASTSIADLLYGVSFRGTPVGRIAAEPASLVSPLP